MQFVVQAVDKPERAVHPTLRANTRGKVALMKLLSSKLGRALLPLVPSTTFFRAPVVKELAFSKDQLQASLATLKFSYLKNRI